MAKAHAQVATATQLEQFAIKWERDAVTLLTLAPTDPLLVQERLGRGQGLLRAAQDIRLLIGRPQKWPIPPWPATDQRGTDALESLTMPEMSRTQTLLP